MVVDVAVAHPSQIRPYDETEPLTHGEERGNLLFAALEEAGIALGTTLVDIGCGYGGLSLAYAKPGRTAHAVDADPRNVGVLNERLAAGEAANGTVYALHGSALDLPVGDAEADLALMMGVIEWLGYADDRAPVTEIQTRALSEARRVLKPGGTLVIGTKNRLFPRYSWSDSQLRKPLVNLLPRKLAARLSRTLWGLDYRGHIYSLWGWKHLIENSGLRIHRTYVPVVSYQYPRILAEPWHRTSVPTNITPATNDTSNGHAAELGTRDRLRSSYYRFFGALGLLGLCGGSFLFVCRKGAS